jgi:aspartate/methionine/tyrosine aminotransferase
MEALFERSRTRLVRNLDLLEAFFRRQPRWFDWKRPRAGTTTFPGFLGASALEFCDRLVGESGIMLVPGEFFDVPGQYLRFGYGRANFPEVLTRFEAWLEHRADPSR